MGVAAVDLSRLQGASAEREAVLLSFLESCASHGFVKIIGHGIPEARLKELFRWVSSVNWGRNIALMIYSRPKSSSSSQPR